MCSLVICPNLLCCRTRTGPGWFVLKIDTQWPFENWQHDAVPLSDFLPGLIYSVQIIATVVRFWQKKPRRYSLPSRAESRFRDAVETCGGTASGNTEHCLEHCLGRNVWDGPGGIWGLGGGFAPSDDGSVFIVPSTDRRRWCLPELFITLTWGSSPNKLV